MLYCLILIALIMFLILLTAFLVYVAYQNDKKMKAMDLRIKELECRVVVRMEDRVVLLEQSLDTFQQPQYMA